MVDDERTEVCWPECQECEYVGDWGPGVRLHKCPTCGHEFTVEDREW